MNRSCPVTGLRFLRAQNFSNEMHQNPSQKSKHAVELCVPCAACLLEAVVSRLSEREIKKTCEFYFDISTERAKMSSREARRYDFSFRDKTKVDTYDMYYTYL